MDERGKYFALEDLSTYPDAEEESISEGEVRRPFDPTQIRVETTKRLRSPPTRINPGTWAGRYTLPALSFSPLLRVC